MANAGGEDEDINNSTGQGDIFQIFVHDVWLKVISILSPSGPRDVLNLASTSPTFELLLEEYQINEQESSVSACHLEEILPLILKELPKSSVLNLRLVCKRVKGVVDKVVDESKRIGFGNLGLFPSLIPSPLPIETSIKYERDHIKFSYNFGKRFLKSLQDIEHLNEYLSEEIPKGGNPLLGKSIQIKVPQSQEVIDHLEELSDDEDPEEFVWLEQSEFVRRSIEILGVHFVHIRYLDMKLGTTPAYNEVYDIIRRVISAFQNLRFFIISDRRQRPYSPAAVVDINTPFSPLPACKTLEAITFQSNWMPESFLGQIFKVYRRHLLNLKMHLMDDVLFDECNPDLNSTWSVDTRLHYNFPVLRELSLTVESESFRMVSSIKAPNLLVLDLKLSSKTNEMPSDVGFIKMILNFPSIVIFRFRYNNDFPTTAEAALEVLKRNSRFHRNLRELEIKKQPKNADLPLLFFTRLFPNLVNIRISNVKSGETADPDLVLLSEVRFHESRIWQENQNLSEVTLHDDEYEDYTCSRSNVVARHES